MLVPFAYLDDLYLDDTSPDTMYVSVCVEHNQAIEYINFSVSLSYMGLCWDDEFEMEFSKDIKMCAEKITLQYGNKLIIIMPFGMCKITFLVFQLNMHFRKHFKSSTQGIFFSSSA